MTTDEQQLSELALFILTSARTTIDEPKRYGPRRLMDALEKLVQLPLHDTRIPDAKLYENLRRAIASSPHLKTSAAVATEEFKTFLDKMIVEAIDEIRTHAQSTK